MRGYTSTGRGSKKEQEPLNIPVSSSYLWAYYVILFNMLNYPWPMYVLSIILVLDLS